jgi:glyoxylase-like metal-dependent hydrolase (beta-lactamase superfamily II)
MDSGQLKTFEGATEFFPGFRSEPAYCHTAGLTVFILENGGERVMFWGDIVHAQRVQLQHPEIIVIFDIDAAAATRQQLLPKLVREDV